MIITSGTAADVHGGRHSSIETYKGICKRLNDNISPHVDLALPELTIIEKTLPLGQNEMSQGFLTEIAGLMNGKIALCVIQAHSCQTSIMGMKKDKPDTYQDFVNFLQTNLLPDAHVLLHSCAAGKGDRNSIAHAIADKLAMDKVILHASTKNISTDSLNFDPTRSKTGAVHLLFPDNTLAEGMHDGMTTFVARDRMLKKLQQVFTSEKMLMGGSLDSAFRKATPVNISNTQAEKILQECEKDILANNFDKSNNLAIPNSVSGLTKKKVTDASNYLAQVIKTGFDSRTDRGRIADTPGGKRTRKDTLYLLKSLITSPLVGEPDHEAHKEPLKDLILRFASKGVQIRTE